MGEIIRFVSLAATGRFTMTELGADFHVNRRVPIRGQALGFGAGRMKGQPLTLVAPGGRVSDLDRPGAGALFGAPSLPDGVMVAQATLTRLVMVRIHVGQPIGY